jgi:uncharacterized membrane protein
MLKSFLIGLPAGARPLVRIGTAVLAAAELCGDKLRSAPDRIVSAGLIARVVSAGVCGAALAPRRRAALGALIAAATAVGAAHLTFAARQRLMARFGQTRSGLLEDALTLTATWLIVGRG